ncbi:hypothetical protein SO802_006314 [Lithocarpus litseifolius]|uniref:Uncharacterized protein n=1 Tax=Lithocarpus litseifolius TaxID=425828 RepID=A0AAW2DQA6_9ROSI
MVPGFEILFDCNNKTPKLKVEEATWVPTDWADHMDLDSITPLLGDHICNIEDEEYWEASQHALKIPYELRANDEDKEGGAAPSDDEDKSDDKSDSSSDGSSNDSGHNDDDSSTNNDDNSNRKNAREENARANQMYHDEYPYGHFSDWSDITNVSSRSSPRYNKHGREVPKLGSYYDLEPSSPIPYTEKEDDIDARLAALNQKLMV